MRGSLSVRASRALQLMLAVFALGAGVATALPAMAGAFATVGPPPEFSSSSGLPDGRAYELVSPADKYGYGVGGTYLMLPDGNASGDGDAVMYLGEGPLAESSTSGDVRDLFISRRAPKGWSTRSAMAQPPKAAENNPEFNSFFTLTGPEWSDVSSDFSHLVYLENGRFDLVGSNPFMDPIQIRGLGGGNFFELEPAGASPDLSTIYYRFGNGFFEYHDGETRDAGVLPDGSTDPGGAVPAAEFSQLVLYRPDDSDNQVSADGSRAFFVSPASGPTELYVRRTEPDGSQNTVLVSQSQLTGHVGEPAVDGPLVMPATASSSTGSYVYASSDGSHAFFESVDRLTHDAPESAAPKMYDFDVDTGVLDYLPGVHGPVVVSAQDGSWMVFENTASLPTELDRWTAGADGGTATSIVSFEGVLSPNQNQCGTVVCTGPARASSDGSAIVFTSEWPIEGFNNAGGFKQVYRYDVTADVLSCVSCPPTGIRPSGDADVSNIDERLNIGGGTGRGVVNGLDDRGVSSDGSQVFFETPDPLVSRDINGKRDVYEWENGTVFLVSSGTSPYESYLLDNSESGSDIFVITAAELVKGDNDGANDVYDARIPHPGDNPPPSAVPCQGDVCQGPPSVPQLLDAPSSATFNGLGNPAPSTEIKPVTKPKAKKAVKPKKAAKPKHKPKQRKKNAKRASVRHGGITRNDRRSK